MLRLFPDCAEITVDEAYQRLDLPPEGKAPDGRPYMIVNMVETVDGQARIGDNTDELGNETDQKLFIKLREQVDCVMAGTRTIALEHYKGPASKQETREKRERRGLRPRPLFATVTRSGVLPVVEPVFQDPGIEIVVFSEAELALGDAKAKITQVREHDPARMLDVLHDEFGVRTLLLEGGPNLNTPFFANRLVDELFLTVAPVLTGSGTSFPIIAGLLPEHLPLKVISLMFDEDHLFLRYRVS
ncbi:MAG TPA: dihydrofolate reductase family protein [Solirubrobacterales bacterium]|jgi:5-amino-6-(5-phosphoribosylamino)uracil reductase|nr:dihydrofolate reductase family protein [Solirubrobacterales bacterium]